MTYVSEFSYHFSILGAPTQHMQQALDSQAAALAQREQDLARQHAERQRQLDEAERYQEAVT